MPMEGLKFPICIIFMTPLYYQICNISCLLLPVNFYDDKEEGIYWPVFIKGSEMLMVGALLHTFYYLLREITYFEVIMKTDTANNAPSFNSFENSPSPVSTRDSKINPVNFDKALEEEKILNQVF